MKTLKTITISFIFAALATVAMANTTVNKYISNTDDLQQVIKEKVESDFLAPLNYFNLKGITQLAEDFEITFFISPEQTIRILAIDCDNPDVYDYLIQRLNMEQLNVDTQMTERIFKMKIKLDYTAVLRNL